MPSQMAQTHDRVSLFHGPNGQLPNDEGKVQELSRLHLFRCSHRNGAVASSSAFFPSSYNVLSHLLCLLFLCFCLINANGLCRGAFPWRLNLPLLSFSFYCYISPLGFRRRCDSRYPSCQRELCQALPPPSATVQGDSLNLFWRSYVLRALLGCISSPPFSLCPLSLSPSFASYLLFTLLGGEN